MKKICSIGLIVTFLSSYMLPPGSFAAESPNYRIPSFVTTGAGGESHGTSHRLYNTVGEAVNGDFTNTNVVADSSASKVSAGYLNTISRDTSRVSNPPPSGSDCPSKSENFRETSYLLSMASFDSASDNFRVPLAVAGEPWGGVSESYYDISLGGHLYTVLSNPPVLKNNIPCLTFPINSQREGAFDLDDYFSDPDGGALTFSVRGHSNIAVSVDPVTHLVGLSQLTGFVGTEDIIFIASDPEGNKTESNVVTLYVYNTGGINNAPVLDFIPGITAKEGESILIAPSAVDPDGNTLTYSFSPPFNAEGRWQTDYNSAGTYNVTVTVSDGSLGNSRQVKVTVLNVNRPPILSPIGDITVNEGELVAISPAASDPDNDALAYSFGAPFDAGGKWQTTHTDAGVYNVPVTVSDGNLTETKNAVVNVLDVNSAPAVGISLSRVNVAVNENLTFIVKAEDPDYDPLTLALFKDGESQPFFSGGIYDFYVGAVSFASLGAHTIKARVTDTHNASAETTVNIEVIDPPAMWGKVLPLLGDFNGDGLVDIGTYNKTSGRWAVSLSNFDGFGSLNEWLTGFGNGTNYQYVNGDFNGDGLTDIGIYNQDNGVWQIRFSEGARFGADTIYATFAASSSYVPITGDFNGDGLSDVGVYDKSNGNISSALSNKSSFAPPAVWISGFSYSANAMPFNGDFNADGLTDIGVFNDGSWSFAVSDGAKFIVQGGWDAAGFGAGKTPVISDFNNDGLTDIGIFDKSDGSWQVRRCNGNGFDPPFLRLTGFGNGEYYTPYALDFNGDALNDAALYDNSSFTWQRLAAKGAVADLMKTITNGLGGTTGITYKSSVYYDNTGGDGKCDLPFAIQTVRAVRQSDGLGGVYQTDYSYSNGLYAADERETRGFGCVKVTDSEGTVSETRFKQDNIFKGLPDEQKVMDSLGKIYSKAVKTYDHSTPYTGCDFPYLSEEENYNFDGETAPKVTKVTYEYDNYGSQTRIFSWGDINVTGDEKEANIEYIYNTTAWILGLPAHSYLKDASGQKVSESWLYYDGHQNFTDSPVKGDLTKEERWLDPKPSGVTGNPATTMTYDDYGNLLTATDALGHSTTTEYETVYHAYPETVTNALGHTQSFTYDAKTGQVLAAIDSNSRISRNEYDVFGRVIGKFGPNDDTAHPSAWYEYDLTTHPGKITASAREEYNSEDPAKIRVSYSFFDGMGRTIETKTEAEDNTKQIVSGIAVFDSRGLVKEKFLPYLTDKTITYTDPLSPQGRGQGEGYKSSYEYDPLGRLIKTTNPDSAASSVEYKQWAVTTIDENGHKLRKTGDAYGRIVKVEEFNHGEVYTTTYKYDTSGNLTSLTDNQGNVSAITYDSLSRKISMNDPDMGVWTYEYDLAGNLKKQTDAKGQIITFEYDALNRLITKMSFPQSSSGNPDTVTYTYDDPLKPYCVDRLSKIIDRSGSTEFFYDNLGREIKSIKTVLSLRGAVGDEAIYTVECAYDALDRLTSLKYPDGEAVNYTYSRAGAVKTVIGNETYVSNVDYNEFGQMKSIDYGNGTRTDYSYNPATLRLEHLTTANTTAAIQDLQYQFDDAGNIRTITDNKNTATQSFTYDDLNRLTSATGRTYGAKYYRYDSIGNMVEKEGTRYKYGENGAGPHALTSGDNGLSIAYDENGNTRSKNNQIFEYDAENRLVKANKPGEQSNITTLNVTLNPGWNFISVPFIPQKINEAPDSRISAAFSSIRFGADYDQISRYSPFKPGFESYDNNPSYNQFDAVEYGKGYVIYVTNSSNVTLTLTGRLPDTIQNVPLKTGWNLIGTPSTTVIKASDALSPLTYNADYDRIVRYNPSTGSYDDITINDNLEPGKAYYIRALRDITWEIKPKYEATEFVYDGDGGRVKKLTPSPHGGEGQGEGVISTTYIGSLYEVEGSVAAGFSLRKHIFMGSNRIATITTNPVIPAQAGIHYYHSDHLGSSNLITDQTGAQVALYEYTPYGSLAVNSINPSNPINPTNYLFTGKELDNTGLYFYGARYYDPEIGRFTQPDTIVPDPGNPQDLNRYSYCDNNPINYTDPTGHWSWKKFWGSFVGGVVSAIVAIIAGPFVGPIIAGAMAGAAGGAATAAMSGSSIGQAALYGFGFGLATGAFGYGVSDAFGNVGRQIYDSSVVIASGATGISHGGAEGFAGGVFGSGLVTGAETGFSYGEASNLTNAPTPHGFWDTVWDIVSFAQSVKAFNDKPSFMNGLSLVADGLALLAPGVPGGAGMASKMIGRADDIGDAVKGKKIVVIGKDMNKVKAEAGRLRAAGIEARHLDLPDLGSAKANYHQNMSKLREALRQGEKVYDMRNGAGGFLGAERNLLGNRGLKLKETGLWE